jgi:CheY-like chemotaxis protein
MGFDRAVQADDEAIKTILLAEDNKLVVSFIRASLEKYGIKIESVDNGEKAVSRTQSGHFDLVVLDNDMTIMDGLSACKIISKDFTVFFYSGEDIAQEALAAGATKFLSKQCPDLAIKAIKEYLFLMSEQ